ncbi:MAG: KamA family radical SAM protein [Candidatus Marinimicrobia bacterium]|nr:KamA family radical SAM protein [Candidatus Neomarinimicrobiota bacterium]
MHKELDNPRQGEWSWQLANSCKDLDTLHKWLADSGSKLDISPEIFTNLLTSYQMGITPYYFRLIRKFDHSDPIYRQIVPMSEELNVLPEEAEDPTGDENPGRGSRPLKALIHRYPNRVLLMPTAQCAVYCRFCFRKRLVGNTAHSAREEDLQEAYDYIKNHSEIEEVILTGGDPLTLGDRKLSHILDTLSGIDHLRLIRIHTRLPVVNPFRLTPELGKYIAGLTKPVWISSHFNHPNELTDIARMFIRDWINLGIPFLNQSVLLKGVNDSASVLRELFMGLVEIKVKPYYLHQADLVQGTSHLRVPIGRGLELLGILQGEIPGYAIPHYVLDSPEGTGKLPLQNPFDLNHHR